MKCNIFRQIPPTAGLPIYLKDIFLPAGDNLTLEEGLRGYLNAGDIWVAYSGTAALYIILESLKEVSGKRTVIIPSFVCPLVPLAIHRAGLKIEICDINGFDFNFNQDELERIVSFNRDILAIIPVYLGGLPLDYEKIENIASANNIFIIEDCAQSLGAEYKGKKLGTLGDFGFFSFCRGKGLTIYEGGAISCNNKEYGPVIDKKIKALVKNDFLSETIKIIELFGYWLFYRPHLFWFVFGLPQAFWNLLGKKDRANIEYFDINFPIHRVSRFRKKAGRAGFFRVDKEIAKQREKASFYIEKLDGMPGIRVVKEKGPARSNYPFVTLIFDDAEKRKKVIARLRDSGLGVSEIYGLPVTGYDYLQKIIPLKDCPGAKFICEREVTLSTSNFIKICEMEEVVKNILTLT
ncbi:MAG: DegT/DnrJ/EryC1/StrS aminotransferase family protein [Candidatus Omnitrophica bacterium]|nr:DegT/DnrJ/EryC1/StrS aminotransferase family protein [Candidatus Omnitrophota bacterium]